MHILHTMSTMLTLQTLHLHIYLFHDSDNLVPVGKGSLQHKEFLLFVTASVPPSPVVIFPTEKYQTEHSIIHLIHSSIYIIYIIIYLNRYTEKFCGNSGLQSHYQV